VARMPIRKLQRIIIKALQEHGSVVSTEPGSEQITLISKLCKSASYPRVNP